MANHAEELLARLAEVEDYRARLDGVLAVAGELAGAPDRYLYVLEPGGLRFHLEHTSARPAEPQTTRQAPAAVHRTIEGGAEWSLPTPSFEIVRTEDDEQPRSRPSPVGPLWSLPLHGPDGGLAGLIALGPASEGGVPRRLRSRYERVAGVLGHAIGLARGDEALRRRVAAAEAQVEAARRVGASAMGVEELVGLLLELALASTQTEAGFVAIAAEERAELVIQASAGLPEGVAERIDLDPERGLLDWSAADSGALFLRDPEAAQALGISSLLAVPLREDDENLGVFALVDFGTRPSFDPNSLDLLEAFAGQIRLMLSNARGFESFAERYLSTLRGLARSLDARRPEMRDHHATVSRCAVAVARELDLGEDEAEAIGLAGLIHDVGLAGAAAGTWETNVEHPAVGASLVAQLPLERGVGEAIATHHEWFDGWGFPRGLAGVDIAREGRILAVAEFLVEMATPEEGVRDALDAERLREELAQRRGSQFDPEVADAARALLERGDLDPSPAVRDAQGGPHGGMHG